MRHSHEQSVLKEVYEDRSLALRACEECGGALPEGVEGTCLTCRLRRMRGGALPANARCEQCGERRRGVLTWVAAGVEHVLLCHNCAQLAVRLHPAPISANVLRAGLRRDLWTEDQRWAHRTGVGAVPSPEVRAVMRDLDALARRIMRGTRPVRD